jgi:filamentous hemagglutinin
VAWPKEGGKVVKHADEFWGAGRVSNRAEDLASTRRGWQVGDPIDAPTRAGDYPRWSAARSRYWKNEAFNKRSAYSPDDLARMRGGLAPFDPFSGEPMQLHHIGGRNIPNPHHADNLRPITPAEHRHIHYYGDR